MLAETIEIGSQTGAQRRSNGADIRFTLDDITKELVGRMDLAEFLNVTTELEVAQHFYNACLGANLHQNIASNHSRSYRVNEKRMRGYLRSFQLAEDKITDAIEGVFAFWREALQVAAYTTFYSEEAFNVTNYFAIVWNREDKKFVGDSYFLELDNEHPTEEERLEVSEIMEKVQGSLRSLENADWLDLKTRQEGLLRALSLRSRFGAIEDKLLTDRLVQEVRGLEIVDESYAATNINLRRFRVEIERFRTRHSEELAKDTKPQKYLLDMHLQAFYSQVDHTVYIFPGILHPPVYHRSWPYCLKFGALGFLVGHELVHGLCSDAKMRYISPMDSCFVSRYRGFVIQEIDRHIEGILTLDANFADDGGLRHALAAYRSYMAELEDLEDLEDREQGPRDQQISERMPGLELLPEQLFFLGFAQLYCSDYREEQFWDTLQNLTPSKCTGF
ncbi:membrane metallo-endopeptidase-like 1 [Drosophila takahashii]|uniref:membrane metallo-endopeptidase-like 1 n=1 Tax=Drosophila takahashii TaxID=29030 RepID=UPI001CF83C8C|nr:membrane metallo-endopeptidase-like 1 [Drosophila takahashii]